MPTRSIFTALGRTALFSLALAGCAEAAPAAPEARESEAADFEVAELKSFSATPRAASCELSAQCVREAGGPDKATEVCGEKAKACMQDMAAHTKSVVAAFGECRQAAAECAKDGASRKECGAEFSACTKAAFAGAASASTQR